MAQNESSETVETLLGRVCHAPVLFRLLDALSLSSPSYKAITKWVFCDPVIAAEHIDAICTTPDGRLPGLISLVKNAGLDLVRAIALRCTGSVGPQLSHNSVKSWKRALFSAFCCQELSRNISGVALHEAWVAGLLHDYYVDPAFSDPDTHARTISDNTSNHTGNLYTKARRLPQPIRDSVWMHHYPLDHIKKVCPDASLVIIVALSDVLWQLYQKDSEPLSARVSPIARAVGLTGKTAFVCARRAATAVNNVTHDIETPSISALQNQIADATHNVLRITTQNTRETTDHYAELRVFREAMSLITQIDKPGSLRETTRLIASCIRNAAITNQGVCVIRDQLSKAINIVCWKDQDSPLVSHTIDNQNDCRTADTQDMTPFEALRILGLTEPSVSGHIKHWGGLTVLPVNHDGRLFGHIVLDHNASISSQATARIHNIMVSLSGIILSRYYCQITHQREIDSRDIALRETYQSTALLERCKKNIQSQTATLRSISLSLDETATLVRKLVEDPPPPSSSHAIKQVNEKIEKIQTSVASCLKTTSITPQILIVDDNITVCSKLTAILSTHGWRVYAAHNDIEAIRRIQNQTMAFILFDMGLGLDKLHAVCTARRRSTVIAMLTGSHTSHSALQYGADSHIQKPFAPRSLLALLNEILNQQFHA